MNKNNFYIYTLGILLLTTIYSVTAPAQSTPRENTPATADTECLFNWAQTFYPQLFSPAATGLQLSSPYLYRYYAATNTYLGVSSADNNAYYLGPNQTIPTDLGDSSSFLREAGCGATKPYPVIFIHGLASSADTWTAYRDYLITNAGWTYGGIPTYDPATQAVNFNCPSDSTQPVLCTGSNGHFYTLNFSNNQQLSLDLLGGELASIIQAVLTANPGSTKVLLIGHSSGGLAARAYLQGVARTPEATTPFPYRDDVVKLITIGTPHQGSFWAEACHTRIDLFNLIDDVGICDLLAPDIDNDSAAIQDLQPDSTALAVLNDLNAHPLPANVVYVSIIGTGQPTLSSIIDFDSGDGIVTEASQNLSTLTASLPLQQKSVAIEIPFRECGNEINLPLIDDIGQAHTCETSDLNVGAEILRNLQ